jgi:AAA family ATP:ADP antiporter
MSSPEAQRLEASVEDKDGKIKKEWNSMVTSSETPVPSQEVIEAEARETLAGHSGDKGDDIYKDIDKQDPHDQDDAFLDRPLPELRAETWKRVFYSIARYSEQIYHKLYGNDLPVSEMLRTLCLAMTLFFMIGGYWLLRSLKDPVLTALCGVSVIPKAKMLSVFVVLGVVSIYNKFLDSEIPRHHLFYLFGTFYSALFFAISIMLMHPSIGLPNAQPDPWRALGWVSYCSIESFGSVMVSLFWSFANSNFSLETAKASYGVMVATAQVGSILGPTFVHHYAATVGVARCYMVGAFCMLLLQGCMYGYIFVYGAQERNATTTTKKKAKAGILEGLQLFWDHNYVKGIFAISCLFMVEVTIVDFTMKVLAQEYFSSLHPCQPGMSCYDLDGTDHGMSEDATAAFTTFMGLFGQATNTLSFLLSLLGTSAVIRYLGLRLTLLLFPTLCLAVIIMVRLKPTLYVVFSAMMLLKANSYALNNPTKEMLYQPTSSAVRYKAKSWIDIFGARGSKALGSLVTNAFSDSAKHLVANGSLVGMAVASFLIWNARFMGRKFDEYTESGYIVGEEEDDRKAVSTEEDNVQMASLQNEQQDTSCALYEEDDEIGPEDEGQGEEGVRDILETAKQPTKTAEVTMV